MCDALVIFQVEAATADARLGIHCSTAMDTKKETRPHELGRMGLASSFLVLNSEAEISFNPSQSGLPH